MAIYQTKELLSKICELVMDGFQYVELTELEADTSGNDTSLTFSAIESDFNTVDYGDIYALSLPEDYNVADTPARFSRDDFAAIVFSYDEIFTLKHAVDNALEYFKECAENPQYSKETIREIQAASVPARNLQAKLAHFINSLKIS
ncbi:MAG: hypothetical protein J6C19_05000 [Lachnospiraceae bacterium]|nr:hypothetical protein [Lachnospiraceae bacterium]